MIEKLVTIILWGLITIIFLAYDFINFEHAYIGMCCMMMTAGLLAKGE